MPLISPLMPVPHPVKTLFRQFPKVSTVVSHAEHITVGKIWPYLKKKFHCRSKRVALANHNFSRLQISKICKETGDMKK